jgi:hypothetical protein
MLKCIFWLRLSFDGLGVARFALRVDEGVLELFDTRGGEIEVVGELFLPVLRKGSEGVRFKVLGRGG